MKVYGGESAISNGNTDIDFRNPRTTIGLKRVTKEKLDQNRAPGQCYDGFICQLVGLWEKIKENKQDYVLNTGKGGDA